VFACLTYRGDEFVQRIAYVVEEFMQRRFEVFDGIMGDKVVQKGKGYYFKNYETDYREIQLGDANKVSAHMLRIWSQRS